MSGDESLRLSVLSNEAVPTTAGNYFVANYPPFSLWQPQRVHELTARLDEPAPDERPLGLYVHVPFCRKRCHFCYFRVYTDRNKDQIGAYIDAVIDEAAEIARRPYVAGRPLRFIYFGGGTPSYLSLKQLARLFDGLRRALGWDAAEEVAFECEPGTLNEHKLQGLADMGVTRLSLGVENFDDRVLELNNRAHAAKEVHRAWAWARAAGFAQINIDLIAGMLGETPANWRACIDAARRLAPDVVTIYQMEIPYNTTIYRQMKEDGRPIAPVADWPTKRQWVAEAFAALEADGYTITSAYTAVRDPARTRFVYRDALWAGADMLGIGVSSFGLLGGVHYQNHHDIDPYVESVQAGRLPVYRALAMTDEERLVRQFMLQLKLGRLEAAPFREAFGVDVLERFGDVLGRYASDGLLEVTDDAIVLTRAGLLEVDRLLHAFFLPEHREVRYT